MKSHLLSIFPLRGSANYVRVYLTPLNDTGIPSIAAFVTTRKELTLLSGNTTIGNELQHQLKTLNADEPIQISISDDDALMLVFIGSEALHA